MTNTYKIALLAALGLAGVTAAQAQSLNYNSGDLLVGIYQPGQANTTVVDLGAATTIAASSYQAWNLSSFISAAGLPSTLGSTAVFGVIGYDNTAANNVYLTFHGTTRPPATGPFFGSTSTDIDNLGQNGIGTQTVGPLGTANTGSNLNDWYSQTINYGANGGGVGADVQGNVNNLVGTSDILWKAPSGNTTPTSLLKFKLTTAGELTYGVAPVPEPATYGMVAGLGLLAFSLRNQFRGKQAKKA